MATILLSAAGQTLGASLGPAGAIAGRALGAIAGALIDRALIRSTLPDMKGPRLSDLDIQTSTEGKAIPRVYGRVRLTGEIVWATRYEETATEQSTGGKGGPTLTTYSYFANFAVAICEGPVHRIGRIWADGIELDQQDYAIRLHLGTEDQAADPLILARQPGGAPAYRGVAMAVFERMALKKFGNRIPQLAFEVIRVVDRLEPLIRAVTVIPGTTEFGYHTASLLGGLGPAGWVRENAHSSLGITDLEASLDELQALCPKLETVALVVSWFGDDLRAGLCQVRPAVEAPDKGGNGVWSVAGLTRADAAVVSRVDGKAAFGGTPSDDSVVAAIRAIRARGLKVCLYPFLTMDIPAGNGLPDPAGAAEQPAYPWRGRITCHPAAGQIGSPDGTAAAATQVAAFVGTAAVGDFDADEEAVVYDGPAEWSFRRMILHYARLAAIAGGVDTFLIGSELRGLSTVRSAPGTYPFVAALTALAADVKAVLGSATAVSYGADWSEWFGHQPADGSGDVHFHLDPFWASPDVDFVGIDAYWPLADWRHGGGPDAESADTPHDLGPLAAGFAAGEGFDWYYASTADRLTGTRTPITDGAAGKPWVFRTKDLKSWWSNPHFDRPGGVESATPTAWLPQSKPFRLVETGCPAVDLGANQPNMFPDAKSTEAGLPHFSRGGRDDLMQRRLLEAVLARFDPDHPDFDAAHNPLSDLDGRRMVDPGGLQFWTWDARPFPQFPALAGVWADAVAWPTGHWLTGRLGGTSLDGLIRAVLADTGFTAVATRAVPGHLDGFVIDDRMAPRQALEPLLAAFQVDAHDAGTHLRFAGRARRRDGSLGRGDLVDRVDRPLVERLRAEAGDLPGGIDVTVSDALRDFRRTTVASHRLTEASRRETRADLPVVLPVDMAAGLAETWLQDVWSGRESCGFALGPDRIAVEPGDILAFDAGDRTMDVIVERIEDGGVRTIEARRVDRDLYSPQRSSGRLDNAEDAAAWGAPTVHVLDIAHLAADDRPDRAFIAAAVSPWPGALAIWRKTGAASYAAIGTIEAPATLGTLAEALPPGPLGLWDDGPGLLVDLQSGTLAAHAEDEVLAGANLAAVRHAGGLWEIVQFARAELVAAGRYRLTRLLRGQGGSEDAGAAAAPAGSAFVLLDARVVALPTGRDDVGGTVTLKIGPEPRGYDDAAYVTVTAAIGGRGLTPWSPCGLKATRSRATGDVTLSWIRRSRLAGADAWTAADVALGEETERYRLEILAGPVAVRTIELATPSFLWTAAAQIADVGATPVAVTLRVAQIGTALGPGIARHATIPIEEGRP
ncbi:baseplate multidomain protein megatron [Prosthecomicrobium hirschii]|uniref:baseplate multidomain protein megatron n=2 Tax=Prosthecodimorpha hirschii TaxID=665126 RepID=UPI0022205641|nr:glycoside hydrolase/phage tail family protein [Prosthecomicrobium hirschii]MCW1840618.1 glycoside hydrolase/phage tail family protein [Prosthecomicrobium hirschii]